MAAADDTVYAGFWIRVVAALIDTLLLAMVMLPVLWTAYGTGYFQEYLRYLAEVGGGNVFAVEPKGRGLLDEVIAYGLPAAAVLVFWRYRSATPGKMVVGARIVDANSRGRPSGAQLIVRYLGYFVSTVPLGLGLLWVAFDRRKQAWHDKLAGTLVLRVRPHAGGRTAP